MLPLGGNSLTNSFDTNSLKSSRTPDALYSTQGMLGELINSTYDFKLVQLGTQVTAHQSGILSKWKVLQH